MAVSHLQPVDSQDLPEYQLDPDVRLDSHGYVQWEYRRWLSSDMRWNGSHESKSMWFELVNIAHGETPVGTLPSDLTRLAKMIQPAVDRDHFERLCKQEYGPLHGWQRCRCGDDIRLMHPVVTRIVSSAFASRANHAARVEAASLSRKLARLTEDVAQMSPALAQDSRKIRWINTFIEERIEQRGGVRRTAEDLHMAVQACLVEARKGRFPEKPET
jgi:hypothetical protein